MAELLYNNKNIIGRLFKYFQIYFSTLTIPMAETLFMIILAMLAVELAPSIRLLYNLDIVCNACCDTAMYDLPPEHVQAKKVDLQNAESSWT